MGYSFKDEMGDLENALEDTNDNLLAIIGQPAPYVGKAIDTDQLGNETADEVVGVVDDAIKDHGERTDNPHKVTAGDVDAYTKRELDVQLSALIPADIIPVSYYGLRDDLNSYEVDGLKATMPEASAYINGVSGPVKSTTLDFSSHKDTQLYLYVEVKDNALVYGFTEDSVKYDPDRLFIGIVITDGDTNSLNGQFYAMLRVGKYTRNTNYYFF